MGTSASLVPPRHTDASNLGAKPCLPLEGKRQEKPAHHKAQESWWCKDIIQTGTAEGFPSIPIFPSERCRTGELKRHPNTKRAYLRGGKLNRKWLSARSERQQRRHIQDSTCECLWGGKLRAVCSAVPQTLPQPPLHMETTDLIEDGVYEERQASDRHHQNDLRVLA